MADWNSRELTLPPEFDVIAQSAQTAITNVDVLLNLIKQVGEVATLFLMLSNPAAFIIRLAAEEIIKLCNDFKEIGAFFLLINPQDKQYANLSPARYGLKIKQDENGLYLFDPDFPVGKTYQQTLQLSDLASNYRDSSGKSQEDAGFILPKPVFDSPAEWELGGYDPITWTGTAPLVPKLENGAIVPQMTPSQVLSIMAGAFGDKGDVARYAIDETNQKIYGQNATPLYTADGSQVVSSFDATLPQTERIFAEKITGKDDSGYFGSFSLDQRSEITRLVSSGRPNFSGSSNIQGIETIAIVALVGVNDYTKFVQAWKNIDKIFGGFPDLSKLVKEAQALLDDSDMTVVGTEELTLTNNAKYGEWSDSTYGEVGKGDYIIGETSGAIGQISKIVSTETQVRTVTKIVTRYDENRQLIGRFPEQIDKNPDGSWKKLEINYKKLGEQTKNFQAGETVFEALRVVDAASARALANGDDSQDPTYNYIKKPPKGGAIDSTVLAKNTSPVDVPTYGEVLGVNTAYPESTHPNFKSVKIKDVIPGYAGFFDEIIQFANNIKSYADKGEAFLLILIRMIEKQIEYFEDIANQIKSFLKIFVDGLPEAGVYWLTIKTYGGNKAIQDAILGSNEQPPDTLKFCAGFVMVSVSGMGGLSATKNLESLFNGLGLKFQEVAMIPETSELDTAVLALQNDYQAAQDASDKLQADFQETVDAN